MSFETIQLKQFRIATTSGEISAESTASEDHLSSSPSQGAFSPLSSARYRHSSSSTSSDSKSTTSSATEGRRESPKTKRKSRATSKDSSPRISVSFGPNQSDSAPYLSKSWSSTDLIGNEDDEFREENMNLAEQNARLHATVDELSKLTALLREENASLLVRLAKAEALAQHALADKETLTKENADLRAQVDALKSANNSKKMVRQKSSSSDKERQNKTDDSKRKLRKENSDEKKRGAEDKEKRLKADSKVSPPTTRNSDINDIKAEIEEHLSDPDGKRLFSAFLQSRHSEESVYFYLQVQKLQSMLDTDGLIDRCRAIYQAFIAPSAEFLVNLPHRISSPIVEAVKQGRYTSRMFNDAVSEVLGLLGTNDWLAYQRSDSYKLFLEKKSGVRRGSADDIHDIKTPRLVDFRRSNPEVPRLDDSTSSNGSTRLSKESIAFMTAERYHALFGESSSEELEEEEDLPKIQLTSDKLQYPSRLLDAQRAMLFKSQDSSSQGSSSSSPSFRSEETSASSEEEKPKRIKGIITSGSKSRTSSLRSESSVDSSSDKRRSSQSSEGEKKVSKSAGALKKKK